MRQQREPWLKLPRGARGGVDERRDDPRFRTHVVAIGGGRAAAPPSAPTEFAPPASAPRIAPQSAPAPRNAAPVLDLVEPVAPRAARLSRSPDTPSGAPALGLDDLPLVSSADWVAKVGEAAKMVDVIVLFYTEAQLGSDRFELAFQTVINEVLPRVGRPYAVYRFSLDAEPSFVAEMAESLGLPRDASITAAGFAWSGPGRRLFLIGDRALESRTQLIRFLRRSLVSLPASLAGEGGGREREFEGLERVQARMASSHAPSRGRRALAILAWCLLGATAVGATVVGVAPQWARSLWHPGTISGAASPSTESVAAQAGAGMPASLETPLGGTPADAQAPVSRGDKQRAAHARARKKPGTSSLSWSPPDFGTPLARNR